MMDDLASRFSGRQFVGFGLVDLLPDLRQRIAVATMLGTGTACTEAILVMLDPIPTIRFNDGHASSGRLVARLK